MATTDLNLVVNVAASGATQTLAASTAIDPAYKVLLTANCVFSLTATAGVSPCKQTMSLMLEQDTTGGRTSTFPTGIYWPDGALPTLTTTAGAIHYLEFWTYDGGTKWFARLIAIKFAAVGTATPAPTPAPTPTPSASAPSSPVPLFRIEADQGVADSGNGQYNAANQGSSGGTWGPGPAYSATGWSGKPALLFSVARYLVSNPAVNWPNGSGSASAFTVMALFSIASLDRPNTIVGGSSDSSGQLLVNTSGALVFNRAGKAELLKSANGLIAPGTRYLATAAYDGTTLKLWLNGTEVASASVAAAIEGGRAFNLGHNGTGPIGTAEDMIGTVAAGLGWIVYLTDAQRAAWWSYLIDKWTVS